MSRVDELRGGLRVLIAALLVRVVGAWLLGEGAPFGPDGTGAEAAVHLGGHPYPLHIGLLHLTGGSARSLSMATGALGAALLWSWGHREGLGGVGGWLAAVAPIAVLPGVLAAGDAPALLVVTLGVWLTSMGGPWVYLGGALAAASVGVKPIALPALVLLIARPRAWLAAVPVLLVLHGYSRPLWSPSPSGGLLGTWWVASAGLPPQDWGSWAVSGLQTILSADAWTCVMLLPVVAIGGWRGRAQRRWLAMAVAVLAVSWATGAFFGGRMEGRYLAASLWAGLPLIGAELRGRRWLAGVLGLLLIWPTLGLLTQLGIYRAQQDPLARVPDVPVVPFSVDPRPIFDACSTPDATRLRLLAYQIAEIAPVGATITTPMRPDGREGELFWPLQVLRPDLKVQPVR